MGYTENLCPKLPWYARAFWLLVSLIIGSGIGAMVGFGIVWILSLVYPEV